MQKLSSYNHRSPHLICNKHWHRKIAEERANQLLKTYLKYALKKNNFQWYHTLWLTLNAKHKNIKNSHSLPTSNNFALTFLPRAKHQIVCLPFARQMTYQSRHGINLLFHQINFYFSMVCSGENGCRVGLCSVTDTAFEYFLLSFPLACLGKVMLY